MRDEMRHDRDVESGDITDLRSPLSPAAGTPASGGLMHLDDLDDYKVAEGEPDIRGWDVRTSDGTEIGEVEDLLVDTDAMKVRYIEVKLDRKVSDGDGARLVLFPIGTARLDDNADDVYVNLAVGEIASLPTYVPGSMNREDERLLHDRFAGGAAQSRVRGGIEEDFYQGRTYDQAEFFGNRRVGRESASYLTRSEQRAAGERTRHDSEVALARSVELQDSTSPVPPDESDVARPPRIADVDAVNTGMGLGAGDMRIPILEEDRTPRRSIEDEDTLETEIRPDFLDPDAAKRPRL